MKENKNQNNWYWSGLSFEKIIYDISIILFFKKKPIGLMPMFYLGSINSLSFFNNNIMTPFFLSNISNEIREKALISTFKFLSKLKKFFEINEIKISYTNPFKKEDLDLSDLNYNLKL